MKNIKAIIFDAYGTLFDVNSAAEKCKDKIGDKWEVFRKLLENNTIRIYLAKKFNEKTQRFLAGLLRIV